MGILGRSIWAFRKRVWNLVALVKFLGNRPLEVLQLEKDANKLTPIPLKGALPAIDITDIKVGDHIPRDEQRPRLTYLFKSFLFWFQVKILYKVFSPMQSRLPSISQDPVQALREAYTKRHRRTAKRAAEMMGVAEPRLVLQPPGLPVESDLGALAVQGPYAGYLTHVSGDEFEWDLRELGEYETRSELYRLGVRVLFRKVRDRESRLKAEEIESSLGISKPGDHTWALATKIALCALSTHTTLVRHWTWTHLMGGEYLAIATRNAFEENHPLCRLLWPHMYGTQQSNRFGNMAQLSPDGDFGAIFSFPYQEMCRLISNSRKTFEIETYDPSIDAANRRVAGQGLILPTLDNLCPLFDILERHARSYIAIYYQADSAVQGDRAVARWVNELHSLFSKPLLPPGDLDRAKLARLVARFLYLVTVHHEMVGASLWNYQLWTHVHPVRVYRDGRGEPLDVYQRLVNMNYLLQVIRAPLMQDFSPLALEGDNSLQAKQAFRLFRAELEAEQKRMEAEPWAAWKIYPNMLEANINA